MKRITIAVCMVTLIMAAGCGASHVASFKKSQSQSTTPSMKQQLQNTMDKANAALPYIVTWSGYKTGSNNQAEQLKAVIKLVTAYPSLKKYVNAQGLFNPADYDAIEKVIDTEDPLP